MCAKRLLRIEEWCYLLSPKSRTPRRTWNCHIMSTLLVPNLSSDMFIKLEPMAEAWIRASFPGAIRCPESLCPHGRLGRTRSPTGSHARLGKRTWLALRLRTSSVRWGELPMALLRHSSEASSSRTRRWARERERERRRFRGFGATGEMWVMHVGDLVGSRRPCTFCVCVCQTKIKYNLEDESYLCWSGFQGLLQKVDHF